MLFQSINRSRFVDEDWNAVWKDSNIWEVNSIRSSSNQISHKSNSSLHSLEICLNSWLSSWGPQICQQFFNNFTSFKFIPISFALKFILRGGLRQNWIIPINVYIDCVHIDSHFPIGIIFIRLFFFLSIVNILIISGRSRTCLEFEKKKKVTNAASVKRKLFWLPPLIWTFQFEFTSSKSQRFPFPPNQIQHLRKIFHLIVSEPKNESKDLSKTREDCSERHRKTWKSSAFESAMLPNDRYRQPNRESLCSWGSCNNGYRIN
jgi:hypothetical protein